jgi:hypothetical protein
VSCCHSLIVCVCACVCVCDGYVTWLPHTYIHTHTHLTCFIRTHMYTRSCVCVCVSVCLSLLYSRGGGSKAADSGGAAQPWFNADDGGGFKM